MVLELRNIDLHNRSAHLMNLQNPLSRDPLLTGFVEEEA